ncbi:MAG: PhzF family phenazine biosynthesis protein, partial [Lysobacter sp.]|nr:PhzF family phenazine biosynthesis protein [Lysobacter sp.]
MTPRRYLQLDVFADRPGAGNPLGVVLDPDGFDDATMQAFAAWTNLSETIFLLPSGTGADYRVRIFTPRQELPFAGHPSVGAARAVLHAGLAQARDGRLVQECAAGLLPVRAEGDG